MEAQRVVVIQDASREVSSGAIGWALHGLALKPGDKLTLLAVIHQVKTPSTLSIMGSRKLLGFGCRVDSSSMFVANERIIGREVARKKNEYQNHIELAEISKLYEAKQTLLKDNRSENSSCIQARVKYQAVRRPISLKKLMKFSKGNEL
uniref:Uncharacterized protein n=1 Tax=Quercus lobata TaxID=97700 RepID=A0A7N2QXH2_QUELO